MGRVSWFLVGRTVAAVVGLLAVLGGFTELGIVARGEGERVALGVGAILFGALLLGYVLVVGIREAIEAKRRGEG